jgi:alkylation response protein AidB-like acyl-CoA dehydrogenase
MLPKAFLVCTLLASVMAPSASAREPANATMKELKSNHLFTLTIRLHPTLEMGDTPAGKRRIFAVSGGEFAGDKIRGTVMPLIGSDLLLVRADGSAQQDVRLLLETEDGAFVLMTYRGVRHASDAVNARMARGEKVDGSDYYLRTAPFFETSSPRHSWINKIVAVGVGERRGDSVVYEVFEIL